MKKGLIVVLILAAFVAGLTACGKQDAGTGQEDDQSTARTATAEARFAAIPEDVPIMEGAENLRVASNDTYIAYEVEGTLEGVVQYYRDQLEQLDWEKRGSSPEQPIGGAHTLLRYKEDKNISVTIQSIPESTKVRILMTIIPTR
jgi:hypothetical protein